MIQVIFGKKGSGKTKRILDMANASVKEAKGNVLFIDDDKSYTAQPQAADSLHRRERVRREGARRRSTASWPAFLRATMISV